MPVVTVALAAHPRVPDLLVALADGVAGALALEPGGVIATHVPTGASAVSGAPAARAESSWPLVGIHGSDRGRERMDLARDVAGQIVRDWCARHGVQCQGVWTEWVTP